MVGGDGGAYLASPFLLDRLEPHDCRHAAHLHVQCHANFADRLTLGCHAPVYFIFQRVAQDCLATKEGILGKRSEVLQCLFRGPVCLLCLLFRLCRVAALSICSIGVTILALWPRVLLRILVQSTNQPSKLVVGTEVIGRILEGLFEGSAGAVDPLPHHVSSTRLVGCGRGKWARGGCSASAAYCRGACMRCADGC